jgi:hypothetical protein
VNYTRLVLAAVVAWVVDSIYGFLVFGLALSSEFGRYPGVFRSFDAVNALLPLMFASTLIGILAVAYIYAKGYEGGPGLQEGLRFGICFGFFELFAISIPNYVVYNYGRKLAVETAVAGFVEMLIMGIVLGLVYKPAPARASAM